MILETAALSYQAILDQASDPVTKVDALNRFAYDNRNINMKEAVGAAEDALKIANQYGYLRGQADSLSNIGFYNMHIAKHEKAFDVLWESLSLYEKLHDEQGVGNAQYNLGLVNLRIGNFNQCVDLMHKSLTIRQKYDDKAGVASCYFQLSYIHQHMDDYESAHDMISRTLAIRRELSDDAGTAAALMVLGELQMRHKNFGEARQTIQESLQLRERSTEKLGYFATLLRWAELHMEMGDTDTAITSCVTGIRMAEELNIEFGVVKFLQMLARAQLRRNETENARSSYLKALAAAEKASFKSVAYELHKELMAMFKQEGDLAQAFFHLEKFYTLKEEVISLQTSTQMKSMQLIGQIEFARREAELEKKKNTELHEANRIISEKNKEITDSINYASRIQTGILPSHSELRACLRDHFILYLPKDIVSGDFFWCTQTTSSTTRRQLSVVASIDCTGHGVPGAFMSMLGKTLLNQTIKNPAINSPADVLDFLNRELPKNLKSHQTDSSIRDGMDMALCAIDFDRRKLYYAGANNPLWILRHGVIEEIKADKQAISASDDIVKTPFTNHEIELHENDIVYIFTDGFADQFGGPKGKKLKYRQLQELLIRFSQGSMDEQRDRLKEAFLEWKGCLEQVDDVCIIGIRI